MSALAPSVESHARRPLVEGHGEGETEVSVAELEELTPQEAARLAEVARAMKHARGLAERAQRVLLRRASETGLREEEKRAKRIETLMDGYLRFRRAVGEPGINLTEKISLVRDLPDGSDHQVFGYAKLQRGERTLGVDPALGVAYCLNPTIEASGRLTLVRKPFVPELGDTANEEKKKESELAYAILRYRNGKEIVERIARTHGVPPDKVPFGRLEFGYRYTDLGHSAKAETAAFMLATALGSDVIPPTVLRMEGEEVMSVQLESAGVSFYKSVEANAIAYEGPDHVAADSFIELAVMDYLFLSSDRHADNLLYDEKAKKFVGIDNGYSLGYSETLPSGNVPVDPYHSVPIEIVSLYPHWQMGRALRDRLQSAQDAIITYLALREGKVSAEEAAALSASVKEGDVAKLISQSFRLLHERVDERGKVVPETTAIAKKEAGLFLERLKRVLAEGRPPSISPDAFKLMGFRKYVNEVLAGQGRALLTEAPPVLPPVAQLPPLPELKHQAFRA